MADRTSNAPDGPDFLRMLGWTVLLSLVFSAGLIIGEQVLRRNGRAPVVDTSGPSALSTEAKDPDETPPPETEPETPETVYSFYEKLSEGDESDQSDPTGESGGS
ncbi:MAG: hypothetical protein ABEL76_04600, partial [Bradymonadaceae bacterium]